MNVSQRPWRSDSFRFTGASWLISNIMQFTRQDGAEVSSAWLHGLSLEAFGGPRWWAHGEPTARPCLAEIPADVLEFCREGVCCLVLDMSNEGQPFLPDWMGRLHEELDRLGLPPERCTLLQQNRVFEKAYRRWAAETGRLPIRIGVYDYFPRRLIGLSAGAAGDQEGLRFSSQERDKRFCCFNFTPRPPRVGMVSWLLAGGFDALGHVSFGIGRKDVSIHEQLQVYDWFPEIETVRRGLEMLRLRAPLLLDLPANPSHVPEYDLGAQYLYESSYFSIVTESDVSNGALVRFTEKSIKPLLMLHPMIVLGNPGTLALLRELGFETFPELFDEAYDNIEDPVERVRRVMQEIARVLSMPKAQLHDVVVGMRRKLLENWICARRQLSARYGMVVEPMLVDRMLD